MIAETPEQEAKRLRRNATARAWRKANPEIAAFYRRRYQVANQQKITAYTNAYRKKNREKVSAINCRSSKRMLQGPKGDQIRAKVRAYLQERRNNEPTLRLLNALRTRVSHSLKRQGAIKSKRTIALVGCSLPTLKQHIESLFEPGMGWHNHGRSHGQHGRGVCWNLDHLVAISTFPDISNPTQQRLAFGWENCQPLWERANMQKHDRLPTPEELGIYKARLVPELLKEFEALTLKETIK